MKNYIARIKSNAKPLEFVWWWIFRCIMIFGILDSLFGFTSLGGRPMMVKQMAANLVGMFAWEICQAMSKKNFMRYLPSYIQDISVVGFFMASFAGAYINLYYSFRFYDLVFHIFGGAAGALFGYEALTAMQHRDKVKSHVPFVVLAAFGFSFICGNAWEIVEFVLDQFFGSLIAFCQYNGGLYDLATYRIGYSGDGGFHNSRMLQQSALHLEGSNAIAGGFDYVVGSAHEP